MSNFCVKVSSFDSVSIVSLFAQQAVNDAQTNSQLQSLNTTLEAIKNISVDMGTSDRKENNGQYLRLYEQMVEIRLLIKDTGEIVKDLATIDTAIGAMRNDMSKTFNTVVSVPVEIMRITKEVKKMPSIFQKTRFLG